MSKYKSQGNVTFINEATWAWHVKDAAIEPGTILEATSRHLALVTCPALLKRDVVMTYEALTILELAATGLGVLLTFVPITVEDAVIICDKLPLTAEDIQSYLYSDVQDVGQDVAKAGH